MQSRTKYTHDASTNIHHCEMTISNNASIKVSIRDNQILDIIFTGRPYNTSIIQNPARGISREIHGNISEQCHRIGLVILKQEIKKRYIGKPIAKPLTYQCQHFTPISKIESAVIHTCKIIHKEWINKATDSSNIFSGDAKHNNFAGKLCMLLLPVMDAGEAAFNRRLVNNGGKYVIDIPINRNYRNDPDFFLVVRDELQANSITLNNWSELCEWFFAANYDESSLPKIKNGLSAFTKTIPLPEEQSGARKMPTENERLTNAMRRFKMAYGLCTNDDDTTVATHDNKRRKTEIETADNCSSTSTAAPLARR